MSTRACKYALIAVFTLSMLSFQAAVAAGNTEAELAWQDDYGVAMKLAKQDKKMLLVYFAADRGEDDAFEHRVLSDEKVREALGELVLVKVPVDTLHSIEGEEIKLIDHAAFAELHGERGFVIIDQTDSESKHYGRVVSLYPLALERPLTVDEMLVMLRLPKGSLTQRTLTFAVLTHPEKPQSAHSQFSKVLASEAAGHAGYQASIRVQGHQGWDSRFHRINAQFTGMTAAEVCAESWPGEGLIKAARECVHSWRQSSGHWSAVKSKQKRFAYDMKRGSNGIWYATGIFAR